MLGKKKEKIETKTNFYKLDLGDISPKGWLLDEIKTYVDNYVKKVNSTWDMVSTNSFYLGGKGGNSYLTLDFIYSLNLLAYQLNDKNLQAKVKAWIEGILLTGKADGNFGKEGDNDYIEKIYALKLLASYHSATSDERVVEFAIKFFKYQYNKIDSIPPTARTTAVLTIENEVLNYFYDITGKGFLLELKDKLVRYSYNFDEVFSNLLYTTETKKYLSKNTILFKGSAVNKQTVKEDLASVDKVLKFNNDANVKKYLLSKGKVVALNLPAVLQRDLHTDKFDTKLTKQYVESLYQNHGLVNGCFSSDSHLNGREFDASTDIETAVETLSSLLKLERLTADSFYTPLCDDIFYNVLPSMFYDDYKMVQRVSSPNQITIGDKDYYTIDKKEGRYAEKLKDEAVPDSANIFGEFVNSLCYKTDDGFAFCHYAPAEIDTEFEDNHIKILEKTSYPFGEGIGFAIYLDKPQELVLRFVVPKYTTATLKVNGSELSTSSSGFIVVKKTFKMGDIITLELNNGIKPVFNEDGSLSFRMGGLLLVNPVGAEAVAVKKGVVSAVKEDYRKAPIIKDNCLQVKEIKKDTVKKSFYNNPYVSVKLMADIVTNWSKNPTIYANIPRVAKFNNTADTIILVPYASTISRISQFPYKILKTVKK